MSTDEDTQAGKKVAIWIIMILFIVGGTLAYILIFKPFKKERLEEKTGAESQYKHTVNGYADAFSGYGFLRSDENISQNRKYGIRLDIEDDAADYDGRYKALLNGDIDMALFPINSFIEMGVKYEDFSAATIISIINVTLGADAILAGPGIKNMADLDSYETKFVLIKNSPSEFLVRCAIANLGFSNLSEDWIISVDSPQEIYDMFLKDDGSKPRAYVLWEHFVSKALKNIPGAHKVFDSSKIPDLIVDTLVVRRDFLADNPKLVKNIVESYFKALYQFGTDSKKVNMVMKDSKNLGDPLTKEEAQNVVAGIRWKNFKENCTHFGFFADNKGLKNIEDMIVEIADVLVETGAITKEDLNKSGFQAHKLFYKGVLTEMNSSNFRPTSIGQGENIQAAQKAPALSDAEWGNLMDVKDMQIKNLSFQRGTSKLTPISEFYLKELIGKLNSMPLYYLKVTGHARAGGSNPEANLRLAEKRAKVVVDYLIAQGINPDRLHSFSEKPSGTGSAAQSVDFQLLEQPY